MAKDSFLKYEALGIANLLRTRSLAVPFYQRAYSWITEDSDAREMGSEKRQVPDFWMDLHSSFLNKTSYFLGTTVLSRGPGVARLLVIDGQQRLATTSLLVSAIRDKFNSESETDFARSIQQDYLGKFDRTKGSDQPVFILGAEDRDFYDRHVVQSDSSAVPNSPSQILLHRAYRYLRQQIDDFVNHSGSSWSERLNELLVWLEEEVQIVSIEVASESDAFLIFETLNDRGADLTVADLLKNYLFSQAGARLDEVQANWTITLSNLGIERIGNQRFTDFARHLLTSKYGVTRERDVYQRIKSVVNDAAGAVRFSQELKDSSRLYYAMLSADSDYWEDFPPSVGSAAEVLVELNLEQYRPLMLAGLSKFDHQEIAKFVPALLSWIVRALAAGNLGAGGAEAAFSDAAKEIHAGRITTASQILTDTRVGTRVPDDSTFKQVFAIWRVTRGPVARYLLRALELQERGESEPELVVNDDVNSVNLEHILPKNAISADWPGFSDDELKSYVHRLGNLCLLQKGPNSRIGNKPWSDKKQTLQSSKLLLTSAMASSDQWGKEEIETRQAKLAELAVQTWSKVLD